MSDPREVFSLKEILSELPCPPGFSAELVSQKWQCQICPMPTSETEMLKFLSLGVPCFGPPAAAASVHQQCQENGGDFEQFVTNPKWGHFPAPKIAFHAGWAGPGTTLGEEKLHTMVNSFEEVVASGSDAEHPPLNLQYFHRNDPSKDPPIPPLASLLTWPSFLTPEQGGVICDTATRVSKRGAVTWWHLDDAGEFVMQTGLAPTEQQRKTQTVSSKAVTLAPCQEQAQYFESYPEGNKTSKQFASVPVKLFIYSPPDTYDWFMHDRESEDIGKIAALHPFKATDEQLPPKGYLPVLNVAVLSAGGPPLISPPNVPHIVVTLNDCVMCEQRRVANLFLEEMVYFLEKAKQWSEPPIMYHYLRVSLKDAGHVQTYLVKPLLQRMETLVETEEVQSYLHCRQLSERVEESILESMPVLIAFRVLAALLSIDAFPLQVNLTDKDRASLHRVLEDESSAVGKFRAASAEFVEHLADHCDVERHWAEPGTIFRLNKKMFCAVVYDSECCAIYGPPRPSAKLAKADHETLVRQQEALGDLVKAPVKLSKLLNKDPLLDELF